MIVKEPFKTQIKQQESHFISKNKSHPQILIEGEQFPKCRKFGIAILGIFVKNQSIFTK
jgi:hypothetical protein